MHPIIAEAIVTETIAERHRFAARVRRSLPRRGRLLAFRATRGDRPAATPRFLRTS
jgi:hypothetical protein